jgi:hypothetical protein
MKEETFLDFLQALGVALLHSREGLQNLNAHMTLAPLLHNVKKKGGGGGEHEEFVPWSNGHIHFIVF